MSDQPKLPVETPWRWINYALGDLGVAEREMMYSQPAFHTVCFLCQGAAEKMVKGFLIGQGWSLRKTHDMVALVEQCAEYDDVLSEMVAEAIILNEYVIVGRYPNDISLDEIGQAEAAEAMAAVHKIRDRVLGLMGAAQDSSS